MKKPPPDIATLAQTESLRQDPESQLLPTPKVKPRKRVGASERIFVPIRLTVEQWTAVKKSQITERMSLQEMGVMGFSLVLQKLGMKGW